MKPRELIRSVEERRTEVREEFFFILDMFKEGRFCSFEFYINLKAGFLPCLYYYWSTQRTQQT